MPPPFQHWDIVSPQTTMHVHLKRIPRVLSRLDSIISISHGQPGGRAYRAVAALRAGDNNAGPPMYATQTETAETPRSPIRIPMRLWLLQLT